MVRVLAIQSEQTGRQYQTGYQNEVFGWLQRPNGSVPKIELGHQAVLGAVFQEPSLRVIASRIKGIESRDERTAAQLVVAGVDYSDVEAIGLTPSIPETLESISATPFANAYAREIGAAASGFVDVFSHQNYAANAMYQWLQHLTPHKPATISPFSQHRINTLMRAGDPVEAQKTLDRIPADSSEVVAQLLAGFSAKVILSAFTQQDVERATEVVRRTIRKRYAIPARKSTNALTDITSNQRELEALIPDPDWGRRSACTKEDDGLLETAAGRSAVDPRARILCHSCPVRVHCLHDSLDNSSSIVRGGLSGPERAKLWRTIHPEEDGQENDEREIA